MVKIVVTVKVFISSAAGRGGKSGRLCSELQPNYCPRYGSLVAAMKKVAPVSNQSANLISEGRDIG